MQPLVVYCRCSRSIFSDSGGSLASFKSPVKPPVRFKGSRARRIRVCGFKVPSWLLPEEGESYCILEECSSSSSAAVLNDGLPEEDALYVVRLATSSSPNSGFSRPDVGLRFALIGENGRAVLKQVVIAPEKSSRFKKFQLQRSDVDCFKFVGPDVGRIEAIWIGPEAGTWRLEEVRITVATSQPSRAAETQKNGGGIVYIFKGGDELLGDGGDVSAMELRPSEVLFGGKTLEQKGSSRSSRDKGMQEYEDLKRLLLTVDAGLVISGTGILLVGGLREAAVGFGVGGAAGFIYLLLLERAVDELGPAKEAASGPGGSLLRPLTRLALVLALAVVSFKLLQVSSLQPQELLAGAAGFLVFRLAVLLLENMSSMHWRSMNGTKSNESRPRQVAGQPARQPSAPCGKSRRCSLQ